MPSRKNKKKSQGRINTYTPIGQYQKSGTKLVPKLSGVHEFNYSRDLVPELIWLDYFAQFHNNENWHQKYDEFLDALEEHFDTEKLFLTGTISDFGRIPEDKRQQILESNRDLIKTYFVDIIGNTLRLYPDCPATWMLAEVPKLSSSKEKIVSELKHSLKRLYLANDEYCSFLRMMPLKRILKHGRLHINIELKDDPFFQLLPRYPNISEDDKRLVWKKR